MGIRSDFTERLRDFKERHAMSQRAFCRLSGCDPKLFFRLRHGHAYNLDTIELIETWMASQDAEHAVALDIVDGLTAGPHFADVAE